MPARVERWFGESNFHHAEFADLRRLVQLKEKQGVTVSLVLPTLDEEETVGPIVRKAVREMIGRVPLLDEILVIDSASTDRTREIAEAEGARVVQHPDVLSRYGSFGARARRSGSRCSRRAATSSSGPTPTSGTGTTGWSTERSAHCSTSHGSSTSGYYQRPIVQEGVLKEELAAAA